MAPPIPCFPFAMIQMSTLVGNICVAIDPEAEKKWAQNKKHGAIGFPNQSLQ